MIYRYLADTDETARQANEIMRKKYREKYKEYHKPIYEQRKADGICVICGKAKAECGYKCRPCAIKNSESQLKHRKKVIKQMMEGYK